MQDTTISVDIAKAIFEVAVSDRPGHVKEQHRLSRARFLRFFAERTPVRVLLEACGSAHPWARQLQALGHEVVLLPPHAVRPYVSRGKTDRSDARALLEAARNEDIHPVPVKSCSQQAITALHRLRSCWLSTRTARINTVRGLLREFGVAIPVGARQVTPHLHRVLCRVVGLTAIQPERSTPTLGAEASRLTWPEQGCGRTGEQAGKSRVGCVAV